MLVALALPALGMQLRMPSFGDLPRSLPIVQTYSTIQDAFPGSAAPVEVVVKAPDVTAPDAKAALADLRTRALRSGVMQQPITTVVNSDHTVAKIDVPLVGTGEDETSRHALRTLRTEVLPAALGGLPSVEYAVTGETAGNADFTATVRERAPIVFAFVLGLAFLLLLVTFRSIVIPIKAILLNLLSVAAAYGVIVWIFQQGHLQGLLGFHGNHGVVTGCRSSSSQCSSASRWTTTCSS